MRKAFFHYEPESKPMPDLGEQITYDDRFARAGHSKENTMLRRVADPGPNPNQVSARAVINCFCILEMTSESGRPGNQIGQIRVFCRQIECPVTSVGPARPRLIKKLTRVFRDSGVMSNRATHRGECVPQRSTSRR